MVEAGKWSQKTGSPPGTLIHIGERKTEGVKINAIIFDESEVFEETPDDFEMLSRIPQKGKITWVDIEGLHDTEAIEAVGNNFGLHPLAMEDIVNTAQRPKVEDYGDYILVIMTLFFFDGEGGEGDLQSEQISLVLGPDFVLSFQEKGNIFHPEWERIKTGGGRLRQMGPDYLFYLLIDSLIDSYFPVIENIEVKMEIISDQLIKGCTSKTLDSISYLKRDMIYLRREISPKREIINSLQKQDTPLLTSSTDVYLRDLHDHVIQVIEMIEIQRELLSETLNVYFSRVSSKMNEVIKILTLIASIFIPLTFIASVYSMRFTYMPELEFSYGYFIVIGVMVLIAGSMLYYFKKKKKWL